jgi:hypothetical protein
MQMYTMHVYRHGMYYVHIILHTIRYMTVTTDGVWVRNWIY